MVTPEAEKVLARFAGRPLCVDGVHADEAPEEKEQPLAGEGWRLLGEAEAGEAYRTAAATTDAQLDRLWALAGLEGKPATVEWDSEIAAWFGAVSGSGCPLTAPRQRHLPLRPSDTYFAPDEPLRLRSRNVRVLGMGLGGRQGKLRGARPRVAAQASIRQHIYALTTDEELLRCPPARTLRRAQRPRRRDSCIP